MTFLANLGEAIADWGMRALGSVANYVGGVVQQAGELLGQLISAILSVVSDTVHRALDALLQAISTAVDAWMTGQLSALAVGIERMRAGSSAEDAVGGWFNAYAGSVLQALVVVAWTLLAIQLTITVLSLGITQVVGLAIGLVASVLVSSLINSEPAVRPYTVSTSSTNDQIVSQSSTATQQGSTNSFEVLSLVLAGFGLVLGAVASAVAGHGMAGVVIGIAAILAAFFFAGAGPTAFSPEVVLGAKTLHVALSLVALIDGIIGLGGPGWMLGAIAILLGISALVILAVESLLQE